MSERITPRERADRLTTALSRAKSGLDALSNSQGWSQRQRQRVKDQTMRAIERILRGEDEGIIDYPEADGYEWNQNSPANSR